jgi:hypothetical protein
MSHLDPERLAALSDDTPTPMEAAHITTCSECTAELTAHRKLARLAAAAQPLTGAPLDGFDSLVPRLRAEGLITPPVRAAKVRLWTLRVAASLTLVTGGLIAGRVTAPRSLPFLPRGDDTQGAVAAPAASLALPVANFRTADDAIKTLTLAQQTYQSAAAFLAAQDTTAHFIGLNQNTYRTRLTALDEIVASTRAAMYQAPQDPVINQYYLATLSAREATLRQIGQTMPATRKLGAY